MPALRWIPVLVLASALSSLGCHGGGSGKLTISARGDGNLAAASVDVGGGISVERVRVVVRELELEGATMEPEGAGMAVASHGDDGDDGGEVEMGPFLVDVSGAALTGSVTRVFDADVPDGIFRELEIVIAPVGGAAAGTPLADMGGSSVIVEGTRTPPDAMTGTPFRFASSLTAKQELETRLVVDHAGNSANVTLVLEVKKWFTAPGGGTLDPTVDANRAAIEANMLASLRFERDDDEDGVDDDHHE